MNLRREATKTIWKTVVFAGAMLGSAGCSKSKPAATTPPTNVTQEGGDDTAVKTDDTKADPCADTQPDPCADPCADPCGDRIRGGGGDGGGEGRGFILS